jgi:hypothetical protein
LDKPSIDTNIALNSNYLINSMATQEEDKVKRTATGGRIYVQPRHEIVNIYDSSRWRLTIDKSNGQVSEPKPSFIKRLVTFITLGFRWKEDCTVTPDKRTWYRNHFTK